VTTPLRVLFLCTGNSARSQMAEALLNSKGLGRFKAESAGSHPAARVNPHAVRALADIGIAWEGHQPRGLTGLEREEWDLIITVCDNARDVCPAFPGRPAFAHWSIDDPAEVAGSDEDKRQAFAAARDLLSRQIDRLLVLPAAEFSSVGFRIAE
jgi:protein-tyrosine-phosphatase